MKTTLFLCVLALNAFAAQPVLVRITPDSLAKLQERDPMIRLVKAPEGEANVVRPVNESLIGESTILHDGKNWTLVPKGAMVFLPAAMKSRVNAKPVGTLLPWETFLTRNRSWLVTNEVSFDQAAGNEAIPVETARGWSKQDKIVIAVHQSGPISVTVAKGKELSH